MRIIRVSLLILAFVLTFQIIFTPNVQGQVVGSGNYVQAMGVGSFIPKVILKKKITANKPKSELKPVSSKATSNAKKKTKSTEKTSPKDTFDSKEYESVEIKEDGYEGGKLTSLPKPVYPKAASAIGVSGIVEVSVIVDENGEVISAEAISGHPLLQASAVNSAKTAKFTPATLNNQPVVIQGVIQYKFIK